MKTESSNPLTKVCPTCYAAVGAKCTVKVRDGCKFVDTFCSARMLLITACLMLTSCHHHIKHTMLKVVSAPIMQNSHVKGYCTPVSKTQYTCMAVIK